MYFLKKTIPSALLFFPFFLNSLLAGDSFIKPKIFDLAPEEEYSPGDWVDVAISGDLVWEKCDLREDRFIDFFIEEDSTLTIKKSLLSNTLWHHIYLKAGGKLIFEQCDLGEPAESFIKKIKKEIQTTPIYFYSGVYDLSFPRTLFSPWGIEKEIGEIKVTYNKAKEIITFENVKSFVEEELFSSY